jgi:hypothetical protein
MRIALILLSAGAATGASGQVGAGLAPLPRNYTSGIDEGNKSANRYLKERGIVKERGMECLIRKSDKSRVCHTRAEWRSIAANVRPTAE